MHKLCPAAKLILFCMLTCTLAACGVKSTPSPTLLSTVAPVPTPDLSLAITPTLTFTAKKSCWDEWMQTRSASAFDCASEEYRQAVERDPTVAEYHFRLGMLNWEGGQKELGRDEIINAVRLDILNKNYAEYLFAEVIPPPTQIDIANGLPLYTEQFDVPHLTAQSDNVTRFDLTEVHAPKNVAEGASALQVKWQKSSNLQEPCNDPVKINKSWASLIIGFDSELGNRQKALEGGLVSLGRLNRSSLGEYALTFWVKGGEIQGRQCKEGFIDRTLRIKLQDQNLAIRESIGNQLVYEIVELPEKWTKYTIPLKDFRPDAWITQIFCTPANHFCDNDDPDGLYFDWSRVKQINFDVPFYSTSGTIFLDEIKIIHLD